MKKQMSFMALAALVIVSGLVWNVARSQRNMIVANAATPSKVIQAPEQVKSEVVDRPFSPFVGPTSSPVRVEVTTAPDADPGQHVAKPGETLSGLAETLLGKDTPTNRNAIIEANASLKSDPDRLIAGKTYRVPTAAEAATQANDAPRLAAVETPSRTADANEPEPVTELKYTAVAGDTVSNIAHALLGSSDQVHLDAIVNANPSLQQNPNHVVAGQAYRIPAPNGLSAGSTPAPTDATSRPATEPDSDEVIAASAERSLRYTARPGDTVTKMAIELLGSDTLETRDAIINHNPSLKLHPDRVIAGQTYWIPAPTPLEK